MICHSGGRSNGKKGFVEEIVRDNKENYSITTFAVYSIFGLEPVKMDESRPSHSGDYWFGDHLERELEFTGESMTVESLREYRKKLGDSRFADDIDKVIVNFGRESGRNSVAI